MKFSKLMMKFADADYSIKTKAPVLAVVLFTLTAVSIPLIILGLVFGHPEISGSFTIILALTIVSSILLHKGKYIQAANIIMFGMITAVILSLQGTKRVADLQLTFSGLLACALIVTNLLLCPSRKSLIIQSALLVANIGSMIPRMFFIQHETRDTVMEGSIPPILVTLFVAGIAIIIRTVLDKVTRDSESRLKKSREQAEELAALYRQAQDKLNMAREMAELSHQSVSSSDKIRENTGTIARQSEELSERFEESRTSLGEISIRMEELDRIAEDQSANITETSAALEEMAASMKNVMMLMDSRKDTLENLEHSADQGIQEIRSTRSSFQEVEKNLGEVNQTLKLILDTADQINILAMNAAIEAARAGEVGNGFAVVAAQIRALAESSAGSTKKIETTIERLVQSITKTGEDVNQSERAFENIGTDIRTVAETLKEIGDNFREVTEGSDEILKAASALNELTVKVVTSVQTTKEHEHSTLENMNHLESFVSGLKGNIQGIEEDSHSILRVFQELQKVCNEINDFVQAFGSDRKSA